MTISSVAGCACELRPGSSSVPADGASACSARRVRSKHRADEHGVYLSGGPGSGSGVHSTRRFGAWSLWKLLLWRHSR